MADPQRLAEVINGTIGTPYRSPGMQALGTGGEYIQKLAGLLARIPGAGPTVKSLTLGDAGNVLQDISYGMPPVSGGNMATGGIGTYGLKPSAMELANILGAGGMAAKAGQKAGKALAPTAYEMAAEKSARLADLVGARKNMVPPSIGDHMPTPVEPDAFVDFIEPVHNVRDARKLLTLVDDMTRNGWTGRPILALENDGAAFALTGSHRIAAAKKAGIQIPVKYVDPAVTQMELPDGSFLMDNIGIGDDKMADLLRKLGDTESARLMDQEWAK